MTNLPAMTLGTCRKCGRDIDATKAAVTVAYDDGRPTDNWHKACAPVEYGGAQPKGRNDMARRLAYYCEENDVLVYAPNVRAAREYAEYRLSPAYGFAPDRAATLKLSRVSASRAAALDGYAITWEAR